jgi:hypothetical protein
MSKQNGKQAMPGPYDPPSKQSQQQQQQQQQKPGQKRKPSQQGGVNKFYVRRSAGLEVTTADHQDGPTVAAKVEEVQKQVQSTAKATALETKVGSCCCDFGLD